MEFETVIGLEVHVELATKTKAFCACEVSFGESANTCCCPVCMGLPGALPVLNKKALEYACKLGLGLNCKINLKSQHARKNYFYPDLPKGYQISQGDVPVCHDGYISVNARKIRINRIHIEEDAGKLIHENGLTLIDFNRAGVPLLEIVTEPDLRSSGEAKEFLEKIREILLWLGISHCRMQEGNLRCDVNVSVRRRGETKYSERCEVKNVNSFSNAVKCIEHEEKRQKKILSEGGTVKRQTRRWDDLLNESVPMREKENEADYRYFPEPDLPIIEILEDDLIRIAGNMPPLPDEMREKYVKEYGLSEYEACEIVRTKLFSDLFEEAVKDGGEAKRIYNILVSDVARMMNRQNIHGEIPFGGKELAQLAQMIEDGVISSTKGKEVIEIMFSEHKAPKEIVEERGFRQESDTEKIITLVKEVVARNEKSVADYKKGKMNAFGFIVGQCMRESKNQANPKLVNEILKKILEG